MLDFRVKKPSEALNWRYQEIIVTEDYLAQHANDPNLITLDSPYEVGKKVLDVFYNGQRLTEGGGYEEVDDLHIRLDIRTYDDQGNEIPATIQVGDEIVIKEWFNSSSILYSVSGLNARLTAVEIELRQARNYSDDNIIHTNLRSRLNIMQDEIDQLKVSSPALDDLKDRVEAIEAELTAAKDTFSDLDARLDHIQTIAESGSGVGGGIGLITYSTSVTYTTDGNGNVIKEEVTGDVEYVKDYKYDENNNLTEEKVTIDGKVYVRNYYYDSNGYLVGEDGEKVDFVSSLSSKALKDIGYLLGEGNYDVEFEYDGNGKIIRETVTGDYEVTKEYSYNADGKIETETMTYGNKRITKTYRYDSSTGKVTGFSCVTVTV